jgi:seryl-tRNA synthetase
VPELEAFIGNLAKQLDELDAERKKIDNKRRRAKTDDDKEMYLAEIRGISAQIKPIRDKLKIAKATLETVPKIEKLFDIEREMERKVIQKERSKER